MREVNLAVLLKSALTLALTERGLTAEIKQSYQPRQQGVPSAAALFFHHIDTVNVGWPGRNDVFNQSTQKFDHIETQRRESRYQISALTPNNTFPAAIDYIGSVAMALQSENLMDFFLANSVGIQHITVMNNVYFTDDAGQFSTNPTVDIVLSHQETVTVSRHRVDRFVAIVEGI